MCFVYVQFNAFFILKIYKLFINSNIFNFYNLISVFIHIKKECRK